MKTLEIYSASWCNPCSQLKQTLAGMVPLENVTVEIVDIEEQLPKAKLSGIRSVPTLILKDAEGIELKRKTGSMSANALLDFIQ